MKQAIPDAFEQEAEEENARNVDAQGLWTSPTAQVILMAPKTILRLLRQGRGLHPASKENTQALLEHEEQAEGANEGQTEESTDLDTDTNGHSPRQ